MTPDRGQDPPPPDPAAPPPPACGSDAPATVEDALRRALGMDAPLDARLALVREAYRVAQGPVAAAVDRLVARLSAAAAGEGAPRPGEAMPPFLLPDQNGRLVALPTLLREGPVAIAFLRGHWCPFCRVTSSALHGVEAELAAAGGRLVAITPERRGWSARLRGEAGAEFPVLTDMDNGYALSLGLVMWVGPDLEEALRRAGRDLPAYHGNDAHLLPIPATFVVRADGIVAARHVDPDYRRRIDLEDLLAAVRDAALPGPDAADAPPA